MVKVQKPNPKSIKKSVHGKSNKTQMKKAASNSSKENVKKVDKILKNVSKKEIVRDVKKKRSGLHKIDVEQDKLKKPIPKKLTNIPVVPKKAKETEKKIPIVAEVPEKVKKSQNKKTIALKAQEKQPKPPLAAKANKNLKADPTSKNKKIKKNLKKKKTKTVKGKENVMSKFEEENFDEEKFRGIVCPDNIKKISKALKVLVEKEVSEKKTIFTDFRYYLNVTSYKIPNCPKRIVKLNLKHSLVDTKTDDVVMIVSDLQRGAKVDYEPTIQHYEDVLREIVETNIKIMPFNQLRNECSSFEAKRKFASTYDYFLCDGRIVGHVVGFCGKSFQRPRTTLHAVRLDNPMSYKSDIERALKRTCYRQLNKGDLFSIPVGNHLFTTKQLVDNIEVVIEQLKSIFPGGYANIRSMHIKIDIKGTSSLPLYVSLLGAPAEVPNVIGPREQRLIKLKKQANDILSKFSLSKAGEIVKLDKTQIKRKKDIREARAQLSKENNSECSEPIKKKVKKGKKIE